MKKIIKSLLRSTVGKLIVGELIEIYTNKLIDRINHSHLFGRAIPETIKPDIIKIIRELSQSIIKEPLI